MTLSTGYNSCVTECQQAYEKIAAELIESGIDGTRSYEIADKILKNVVMPEVPSRKGKNPSKLSLKPTKETEGLILNIMNDLVGDDFISENADEIRDDVDKGVPDYDYTDCINCMACANACPKIAIKLTCVKEPNPNARYRNPNITLAELIQANRQN